MTNGMTAEYAVQEKLDGEWYFLNSGMRLVPTPNLARWFNSARDAQVLFPSQYNVECRIIRRFITEWEPA